MEQKNWCGNNCSMTRAIMLVALCVFSIYLALAQYTYPSADDFFYATVPEAKGFLSFQQYFYVNWCGRYMATLILSAIGQLSLVHAYPFFSLLVFAGTLFGFASLAAALLRRSLYGLIPWGIAVVACVVYLGQIPSLVEAFYWLAGAYTYQMAVAILLIWLALAIRHFQGTTSKLARSLFFLLPIILLGLNEITAIVFLFLLGGFLLLSYKSYPQTFRLGCTLALISAVCLAILLLAPGNARRSASYPFLPSRHLISFAVPETARQTARFLKQYVLYVPIWLSGIAIWLSRGGGTRSPHPRWTSHPAAWMGTGIFLVFVTLFPLAWEYGDNNLTGEGRTYNITYLCFMATLLITIATGLERYVPPTIRGQLKTKIWAHLLLGTALTASLLLTPNTLSVWHSLQTAPAFLLEQLQRDQIFRTTPQGGIAQVPKIHTRTKHLFWGDIEQDPAYWSNQCISDYYHLKSVQSFP